MIISTLSSIPYTIYILSRHSNWIIWNLFLAFIPLGLSFWLFRNKTTHRSVLWWLVLGVFIAFLPNAPYLLTDVIHLIQGIRAGHSIWITTLVLIPVHLLAIISGFQAYVISVMNQSSYLRRIGSKYYITITELTIHGLSAIGIYLGRFLRFNSWDLVTQPDEILASVINDLTAKKPIMIMVITFMVLTVLYWIAKQVNIGLYLRFRSTKSKKLIQL